MRRQQHEAKTMSVVFCMTTGPLLIHQVPAKTSLDAIYYHDECLKVWLKISTGKDQRQPQMALNSAMIIHVHK